VKIDGRHLGKKAVRTCRSSERRGRALARYHSHAAEGKKRETGLARKVVQGASSLCLCVSVFVFPEQ